MKLKKIVSVLLVGAMAAAMLAGCGGSSEEEAATTEAAGSAAGEASAVTFDETQEISMYGLSFYGDGGLTEVQDAINEISESKINVHVTYNPMDVSTYMEQIGLMLSGGEAFDLVMVTSIPVVSFATMTAQNELMDIAPYLDEYAPETKALMSDYLSATTVGDAVYAIPSYRQYNSSYYIVMRQDILDELGLSEQADAMASWSDFEAILKTVAESQDSLPAEMQTNAAISNTDAQGNVFTGAGAFVGADSFADDEGFDFLGDNYKVICVQDGTVENYFATDEYRQAIERVNSWYNEGLVYKDAATSEDTGDTLIQQGVSFSEVVASEYGIEAVKESATGYDLKVVKVVDRPIQTADGNSWGWAVPVTSENPEAAVAFLNLMYTDPDIENLFVYGIEGRDYDVVDGEAVKTADAEYSNSDFFFGNQFNAYPAEGNGASFREDALADTTSAEVSPYYGCVIDTADISNEITAVSNVLTKYEAGLESGSIDVSNLDTMLSEMESAGVQTIIDAYQSQLDAWLAEQ